MNYHSWSCYASLIYLSGFLSCRFYCCSPRRNSLLIGSYCLHLNFHSMKTIYVLFSPFRCLNSITNLLFFSAVDLYHFWYLPPLFFILFFDLLLGSLTKNINYSFSISNLSAFVAFFTIFSGMFNLKNLNYLSYLRSKLKVHSEMSQFSYYQKYSDFRICLIEFALIFSSDLFHR